MTARLGWVRDPDDPRDRGIGHPEFAHRLGASAPPVAASAFDDRVKVRDQEMTSSCVGHAVASALRLGYLRGNGTDCNELSPLFVYYNARKMDGGVLTDNGTTIRSAIKGAQQFGAAPEFACSFSPERINAMPYWSAYRTAHALRGVRGYYRISRGDVDGVRRAIAARCPVVAGWEVSHELMRYRSGVLPALRGPFIGGHAMTVVQYDGDTFTLLNSWGAAWGELGFARVDSSFIANGVDLWAIDV